MFGCHKPFNIVKAPSIILGSKGFFFFIYFIFTNVYVYTTCVEVCLGLEYGARCPGDGALGGCELSVDTAIQTLVLWLCSSEQVPPLQLQVPKVSN